MKTSNFVILITVTLSACADLRFAAPSGELTHHQLIAARDRLNSQVVAVVGYFDLEGANLISGPNSPADPIAVDLTKSQVQTLKRENFLHSGYVRVVGLFEYVGAAKVLGPPGNDPGRRILVSRPAGFRGAYLYQLTKIKSFAPTQDPTALELSHKKS